MKNTLYAIITTFVLFSCSATKDVETFKINDNHPITEQTLVYALPQTAITIHLEVTKVSYKKGPYSEFAQKYLALSNVPMWDSQTNTITNIKITPNQEADPTQYYGINYKSYPLNLRNLLNISGNGVILDFANSWKTTTNLNTSTARNDLIEDPGIIAPTIFEKVDTFYKTIVKDSTFKKIPILKRQLITKTTEDIAQEIATTILEIRKQRLALLSGDSEYHPDGSALRIIIAELARQEEQYLSMFIGVRLVEKKYYTFTTIPQTDMLNKEVCYFSPEKGIQEEKAIDNLPVVLQIVQEQELSKKIMTEKAFNQLYIRIPTMSMVTIKLNDQKLASERLPIYQLGAIGNILLIR
jgi:hypothetical protein